MYENTNLHQSIGSPEVERGSGKKKIIAILLAILVVGVGFYVVRQKGVVKNLAASSTTKTANLTSEEQKKEVANVTAAVGKLMLLPKGDEPVLARVEDPDALVKQQAFFAGAEKGDTLLIYPKTQRAILYSNSRNLIVNSGPIIAGDQGQTAAPQGTVPQQ